MNRYRSRLPAHNIEKISRCVVEPVNIFDDLTDQFVLFFSAALQQARRQRQGGQRSVELLGNGEGSIARPAAFAKLRNLMKNDQRAKRIASLLAQWNRLQETFVVSTVNRQTKFDLLLTCGKLLALSSADPTSMQLAQ